MIHEINCKNRVHDECHNQRSRQGKDQHGRQIDHKFTNDARPEKQREERRQVVSVPESTGIKTSPAAIFADSMADSFPLSSINIRCVFSITTIASSTIIPSPKSNAKSTMKFNVHVRPTIKSAAGKNMKATNILSGTDKRYEECIGNAHKKHQDHKTSIKPITMEFTRSLKEVRVAGLITGDYYIQICGNMLPSFLLPFLYFIGSFNQIFPGPFNDIECHYIFAIQPCILSFLYRIFYISNIF